MIRTLAHALVIVAVFLLLIAEVQRFESDQTTAEIRHDRA